MSKHVYIRHGRKAFRNGEVKEAEEPLYAHDPPLTDKGREEAQHFFTVLLWREGIPSSLISSPYLRTRETAQIAQAVIAEETGTQIPLRIDANIGEYLGYLPEQVIVLHPDTEQFFPHRKESWAACQKRIWYHRNTAPRNEHVWFITHGVVMKEYAKALHPPRNIGRPPYLGTLILEE